MKFLENLLIFMLNSKIVKHNQIQGYSESEVLEYENARNIRFPHYYREYLLFMGKNQGELFQRANVRLEYIDERTQGFLSQVNQYGFKVTKRLLENGFLFYDNQGTIFNFFYFDSFEDNPEIFTVDDEGIEVSANMQFTDFLWDEARKIAEIIDSYLKGIQADELPLSTNHCTTNPNN